MYARSRHVDLYKSERFYYCREEQIFKSEKILKLVFDIRKSDASGIILVKYSLFLMILTPSAAVYLSILRTQFLSHSVFIKKYST